MIATPKRLTLLGLSTSLLLVALVAGLAGCGSSSSRAGSTPTATPTVAPSPTPIGPVVTAPIVGITMFSATTGWGTVQSPSNPNLTSRIAYTVDGGHTWYDVTPSGLAASSQDIAVVYPLSTTEAWAWAYTFAGGGSTTLWYTTNAAAHWSTSTVATGAVKQLDFIDSQHGWLAATPAGGAASHYPIDVWNTTDGGASWMEVASSPIFEGHTVGISFVNATTGFVSSDDLGSSNLLLSVTHDAGHTWTAVSLTKPTDFSGAYAVEPPVFTSSTTGVLVAVYATNEGQQNKLAIYSTADTGATWTLSATLSVTTYPNPTPFSVTMSGEVFAASTATNGSVTLYDLPTGATSWTQITSTTGSLLTGITSLSFFDATHGWAVTKSGLIGTTDSGMTWTVLHP